MTIKTTLAADDTDLLYGVPRIAEAFNLKPGQVYHLKEKHGLPTFKIGRCVCARRSAVEKGLVDKEAAAAGGSN